MSDIAIFLNEVKQRTGVALNTVQRQAVQRVQGQLLLLASPGSGKTTTIIMRIGYLLACKQVSPIRIKAVTFSRASAGDMKERFQQLFPDLMPVPFSTIHSLAFEVVRDYLRERNVAYHIIEGDTPALENEAPEGLPLHKRIILRDLFAKVTGELLTDDGMDELTTYISFIKNRMLPKEEWAKVKADVKQAAQVLEAYEEYKEKAHAKLLLDYDDMLTLAEQAFREDGRLLRRYQQRYDYVLSDESQDTSLVQHQLIARLAEGHGNLCVVADDDQSIYSWRGADPAYLLRFGKLYPQSKRLLMEQNYRSAPEIVDLAARFIKRNKHRYEKKMFTSNPSGGRVMLTDVMDYSQQPALVVERLKQLPPEETAVLYRNNASAIPLINALDLAGIPFYSKDAGNRFFTHWIVQDILNFMRMSFTDKRIDLLEAIYTKCKGYITRQQLATVRAQHVNGQESVFDTLLHKVPIQDYQVKQLQECKQEFAALRTMKPKAAIGAIRFVLGYERALERMCERLGFRKEQLLMIVQTLEGIAEPLDTLEAFAARLKHLEEVTKAARARSRKDYAVTLSTLHSAKGLEFDHVLMVDLIEGILPSSTDERGVLDQEVTSEEAARLFYVGMTRARSYLELVYYQKHGGDRVKPSSFVTSIDYMLNPQKQVAATSEGSKGQGSDRVAAPSKLRWSKPSPLPTERTSKVIEQGRKPHNKNLAEAGQSLVDRSGVIKKREDLRQGQMVEHVRFGKGSIRLVDGEKLTIGFPEGDKQLLVQACLDNGLLISI